MRGWDIRPRDSAYAAMSAATYTCPVCQYPGLTAKPYELWPPPDGVVLAPPYWRSLGRPSYEVCPRCGFEFGNDDNPGTAEPVSFEQYRREWEADGRPPIVNGLEDG
jgi:hypothetical protein